MAGTIQFFMMCYLISFERGDFYLQKNVCCETQMPLITASSKDGKGHKDNILIPVEGYCHKKCSCAIWRLSYPILRSYDQSQIWK